MSLGLLGIQGLRIIIIEIPFHPEIIRSIPPVYKARLLLTRPAQQSMPTTTILHETRGWLNTLCWAF